MRNRLLIAGLLGLAAAPPGLAAQVEITSGVLAGRYESYSIDPGFFGLGPLKVTALTVPLGFNLGLGRFGTLALSSGFAQIDLTETGVGETSVSGILDTEIRLGINVVPGNLILVTTAVIPTGIKPLQGEENILAVISSDVIGFAAPTIGTGGSFGGGLVGAVPVGRFALGLGATYKYSLSYAPLQDIQSELQVGPEFRVRAGLEGPLGPRTYLRLAGVFATRGEDELGGARTGSGNRVIGYVALNQGVGNSQVTVYAFDVYRSDPSEIAAGTLPKGNLLAAGTRIDLRLGQNTAVIPRAEFRTSEAESRRAGRSFRFGLDLRQTLSPRFVVVLQGDRVVGNVRDVLDSNSLLTDFDGFRASVFLTVTP